MEPSRDSTDNAEQPSHSVGFSRWCTTFVLTYRTFSTVYIAT